MVQPMEQADDGSLAVEGKAKCNVEGSFGFDGTEDGMHYGPVDLNGNLAPMATDEASLTAP